MRYNAAMRFTLGKMFLAVAMLALACAGMMYRTRVWFDVIATLTILLYVIVALKAIGYSGKARVNAIAFVAIGGGYLALASSPWREVLVTNYAVAAAIRPGSLQESVFLSENNALEWPATNYSVNQLPFMEFLRYVSKPLDLNSGMAYAAFIGHCVFSWIFAVLAAWFVGRMYDRRERIAKEAA